ncbi:MAG: transposase [Oceanicoccus sp.]|jgi:transposase
MSKYSRKLKIIIAKRYLGYESSCQLSREYNIPSSQIQYWGAVYSFNSEQSFLPPSSPYSAQDKFKILTKMQTEDWSLRHTSAFFNLSSPGTLFVWLRNYESLGMEGLRPKKRGIPMKKPPIAKPKAANEMTPGELKDELEYLRAENDVLKKLDALLQEKRLRAKKKQK